ncbi:MAG: type II toxin-antitoxin system RelE/ParE family toxin [Blastochloris sp.]|nr:type II toxin-antitoxin system RelE/ParE family toxin [Blastochloris sp.]
MDYKVILSPRAIKDLEEIVRYISLDKPKVAFRFGNALIDAALALGHHPEMGVVVQEFDDPRIREWIHKPYRIIYRIDEAKQVIGVARFWHGAQPLFHDKVVDSES